MSFVVIASLVLAAAVLILMAIWSLECFAALLPQRRPARDPGSRRPRVAVLVPAHNEAGAIHKALDSLAGQMLPGDRLIVVADNCSDDTAAIARACALVLERQDPARHGKSYALDYGMRSLAADPPDVVVFIDADCHTHPGAIDRIARLAYASRRPVQATYILESGPQPSQGVQIGGLAFLVKNFVRPSGLARLGLPCFLNGSGMAFPAEILTASILANGRIAEDKWLTVDLAIAGHVPVFCPDAKITSSPAHHKEAQSTQRTRWLHGHLECMLLQGPRLLAGAIRSCRIDLLALLLDLGVPPVSLLLMLWIAALALTSVSGIVSGYWLPAILVGAGALLMAAALSGVVVKFGHSGDAKSLLAGPAYVLSRFPFYLTFVFRRQRKWVRTERDPIRSPDAQPAVGPADE